MTREQAMEIVNSGITDTWDDFQVAVAQLCEDRLIVDFGRFHAAVENLMGEPIFNIEFGSRSRADEILKTIWNGDQS